MQNQGEVREILKAGAQKASTISSEMIEKIRTATGIRY